MISKGTKEEVAEIVAALRLLMQYGRHAEAIRIVDRMLFRFGTVELVKVGAELRLGSGSASEAETALGLLQSAFEHLPWDPEVVDLLARAFETVHAQGPAKASRHAFVRWTRKALAWRTTGAPPRGAIEA